MGDAKPGLVRAISRFDLTAAVVNGIIGSAVFSMPGTQAALTGTLSPLAYLVAGLGVLTIVLCFAEVASRFREGGGPYLYAREAFSPMVGFQAGWFTFWIRVTAVAANLNALADYAGVLAPLLAVFPGRQVLMAIVTALVVGVNLVGVRQAAWTVNVFTIAKVLPFVVLVALGLPRISAEVLATQTVGTPNWTEALLLLMFAYGGFEAPLIPAGEAKDPRRDSGPALLLALGFVAVLYMLVQLAIIGVLPEAAKSKTPVAGTFALLLGPPGLVLAALAAMVSIYGYATGNALQSPRVLHAMADRGELPRTLAAVHPRWRTPHVAIVIYGLLVFLVASFGSFAANAVLSAIARLVTYGLTCAALPILRRREAELPTGFRVRGGPIVASLGCGFCLWLLATRSFAQAGWLLAILGAGAMLRAVTVATSERKPV